VAKPVRAAKRGRPAKLSLEQIVATAAGLILTRPAPAFSIHSLARELNVSPMAIYRHVESRDALLQAVAQALLEELQPVIPDADWPLQLRAWATQIRRFFLDRPALFSILGWREHIAIPWLRQIAALTRILAGAGLEGIELADAVQWVSNTLMGNIYLEICARHSGYQLAAGDIDTLPERDADTIRPLAKHLAGVSAGRVFEHGVDRIIDSLQAAPGTLLRR